MAHGNDLDVEGCRRLAGAVIKSGLDLPSPARERFLDGDGFRFWSELAGADPARLQALIVWTEARPTRNRPVAWNVEDACNSA